MSNDDTLRKAFETLVVKTGVALGGLTPAERERALALAATALPLGRTLSEPEVNAALKRCLHDEGAFLDTDHVELRRWLVDAGWLQRDGYGRAYERLAARQLPESAARIAWWLDGLGDLAAWAERCRQGAAQAREARRAAWVARQQATAG